MKFLSTVFAVVATAATALAQMSIDTPAAIVQCQPVALNWRGGTPPYFLSIIPGGQVSAAALIDFGEFSTTSYTWTANITAGTSQYADWYIFLDDVFAAFSITLKLTGKQASITGNTVYSSPITIQSSSNSACIGGAAASSQSSIASSASSAATTTVGSTTAQSSAATGAATSSGSSVASSASSRASSAASAASSSVASATGAASSAVSSRVASASSAVSSVAAGVSSAASSAAAAATSPASAGHVNGIKLGSVALALVGGAAAML
ncbi:hypothetical protein NliqN6_1842 [Naganishia liquefaciens]|uniref:Uncharacterized protein n=1 Tax=Naganishia liquefaciens TaxID=104408 RepID=A0A8H3TRT0_9TREE|nr:hypothetical protein NliqN6_1842 [Naganishia liquefaciens]